MIPFAARSESAKEDLPWLQERQLRSRAKENVLDVRDDAKIARMRAGHDGRGCHHLTHELLSETEGRSERELAERK